MAFTDITPDTGHWCSRQDCCDLLKTVPELVKHDEDMLNRAIARETDYAQSILRPKWPDGWPFSSPTDALRGAVATLAVYRLFFRQALPDELEWLRDEAEEAREFLRALASGTAQLEPTSTEERRDRVAVTSPTDWSQTRWGFKHAAEN